MHVTGNLAYKTIPTNKGNNLIMLKNYTFSKHTKSRNYYCSSKLKGCRARFKMDEKGDIIHGDFTHTHDPPKYAISSSGHYIKFKLKGCRARFKMDEKGDIIHGDFTHTHDPPKYAISSSGNYVKL
ncbi:hypothetical protein ABMA28_001392 [Loxostege sticticalis]|uniref:FLYWCH-type domain-containing protein n=1 Tax=Loxostege sticticalis TaxID=481309 RepID=A0ABD0T1I0_LOXSC